MKPSMLAVAALVGALVGCSGRPESADSGRVVDSSGGSVALGLDSTRTYRPGTVAAAGAVEGSIAVEAGPADSVAPVARFAHQCGDVAADASEAASAAGVLVWIDGVTSGKPPSPVRRETVTIENCRFSPRVLAVSAGTTINFLSRDAVSQTARFYREASSDVLEEIRTVDHGQVVPSERIARVPGMVEARSVPNGGSPGYIAVFDHPYFAVTDSNGAFTIDGLPAGSYTVKLWREGMTAPEEQRVVVTPGGKGQLEVTLTRDSGLGTRD